MYKPNTNTMGCCGFSQQHSENRPISLYGVVDSEEESKEFLACCAEQVKRMHPKYKYGLPSYWSFKHPDVNRWYVSYQVPCRTETEYKDSEVLEKELVYNKTNDSFSIKRIYKDPSPLNKYQRNSLFEEDNDVSYLQGFGTSFPYFLEKERMIQKGRVVACTLYALTDLGTKDILNHIKTERDVLFDVKWHNPFYPVIGKVVCDDNDYHTLHTFFYRMS